MNGKSKIIFNFNRILLVLAFAMIFFVMAPITVKAEGDERSDQVRIEEAIEASIDRVIADYINGENLNDNISSEVNKAIDDYFADMDMNNFEKLIKESIKGSILGSDAKLQSAEELKSNIKSNSTSALKTNLNKLQEMFEKSIEDKTYEYSNSIFNEKVAEEIGIKMRSVISSHNESCYTVDQLTGKRTLKPGAKLIGDVEAENMIVYVVNNVINYATVGAELSNNVKNATTEFIYLANYITDYLYTDESVTEAANSNGANLTNMDRLVSYIKGSSITQEIRSKLDVQATEQIKEIIKNSVNEYLGESSGKAIFNDIKTSIYYYINDNGGFDVVARDGFSDELTKYMADQITKILGSNIQYQVAPYVSKLVKENLEDVLVETAHNCIANGVEQIIKDSVPSAIVKRFEYSLSDIMKNNLGSYADNYLKNLVNNTRLKNMINSQFTLYTEEDYADQILRNVGTEYRYVYDAEGNVVDRTEIESACVNFAKNTLLTTIKAGVISEFKTYMNSSDGYKIINLAKKNVYDVLNEQITEPLLEEINTVMVNWVNDGIVVNIWNSIKEKVYLYVKELETNIESFQTENDMVLGDILMEVRYDGADPYSGKISLEEFVDSPNLISAERGAVLVPIHSNAARLEDATVEVGISSLFERIVEDSSTSTIADPAASAMSLINPYQPNPYGLTVPTYYGSFGIPGPAGLSRTIAQYSAKGVRELTAAEAYILAHEKNTSYYPDHVQMAYWNLEGKTGEVDVGVVDTSLIEEVLGIIKIVQTAQRVFYIIGSVYSSIQTLMGLNFSEMFTFSSEFWANLSFSSIGDFFKNFEFSNLLTGFSDWFKDFELITFFDNVYKAGTLQAAGSIIESLIRNEGIRINPLQVIGGFAFSPLNPFFAQLKSTELAKLVLAVGNIFDSTDNFIYAVETVFRDMAKLFAPLEREIVDGKDPENPSRSMELYAEAEQFEFALNNWNDFKEKNGATLVDRTDYSKVEVSYSKNSDEILVGPFTIDYVREFYVPFAPIDSDLMDTTLNMISYTGIIDAKLYADDQKTTEISDWKFVYPDKTRTARSPYDQNYEYPYPNEVFYLQFPSMDNYSINTLSKMQFQLEKMDADGQVYELRGTYDQLLWVGVDVPIVCPLPAARCICGVIGGHPWPSIPPSWCPMVCCLLHFTPTGTPPFHMAYNGHLMGHVYFCQQVSLGSDLHAMNLEQILYSKIYKEYSYVDIELGEEKPYNVTSVNTTSYMAYSINKGNITENVNEVPVVPFLPNYETYPGYENYPNYEGNPNYPNNPYTFNNEEYKDYASYPLYTDKGPGATSDPTYPYYAKDEVIPLTFHVSGTVWLDNPTGKESDANGVIDENERGIPNVEVILYKKDDPDYIAKTLTNETGYYIFEYVRVGFDYYVEFAYDGMTYKTTEYLQSDVREHGEEDLSAQTQKYMKNPENYLTSSHAIEDVSERDTFNDKFYHISENLATAKDGSTINLEYKTWQTPNGSVSTMITVDEREITKEEFKMYARSMETDLYFPVDNQYQVDFVDLDLYNDGTDVYTKTYPCLEHVNLGLIQREQGDFTTKTDTYQVITTIKTDVQKYKYDDKEVQDDTYDILSRDGNYYTEVPYNQELNPDDCAFRYDSVYSENSNIVSRILSEKDELNTYIEYKLLIKNRATLETGRLIEVENSFDQNLEYISKYDYTDLASWIEIPMDGTDETFKEEILWEYREGEENGYSTIYTDDLKEKNLKPGEVIEVHLVLKVKKDENRWLKMDLDSDSFKEDITEVTIYSYDEGLTDKTSNPGSARLGNARTYSDGTDPSPLFKLIYDRDYSILNSNTIQGYAWDDLISNRVSQNNQLIGNGIIDEKEQKINNVKVELIETVINKETAEEVEVLRKTASGTDYYRTGENIRVDGQTIDIQDGEYKFLKLETGTYKVKFTYGDEYQLTKDLTYNAQDYKTLSLDTIYQEYYEPKLEVMLMLDTSDAMSTDNKGNLMRRAITPLVNELYKNIQTVKIGGYMFSEPGIGKYTSVDLTEKPAVNNVLDLFKNEAINAGRTLSDTIEDALKKFSHDANGKVFVIMTDGYMKQTARDRDALEKAERLGVKVITIACATDEWDAATFGTEDEPTAGILYNVRHGNCNHYVSEIALEDILLEFEKVLPNLTDAKDVEYSYSYYIQKVLSEDIYSRKHNIDYSSIMVNENAEVLHLENIKTVQKQLEEELGKSQEKQDKKLIERLRTDILNRIRTLAENTKVTAITPNRNITFLSDKARTQNVNLGLMERPKVEFKVDEKISRIQVILANGETIIDTTKDLTQNVQEIPNDKFSIFMDEEIMQGATLNVQYKITVTNNGNIDTLADYFTYDMFNEEDTYYATTTVANKIGTIYDYYTNNIFRAEDNNNMEVEVNDVILSKLEFEGVTLKNWDELVQKGKILTPKISRVETRTQEDGRAIVLKETVTWENKKTIALNSDVERQIDNDKIKVIETKSLKNTPIYPSISKETLNGTGVSSISFYVNYSKQLSGQDTTDTLMYRNSAEIVERLNLVGRRDYLAIVGNYIPQTKEIKEYDSIIAEDVIILPPFGEDKNYAYYIIIAISATLLLVVGIVFIKKKVI